MITNVDTAGLVFQLVVKFSSTLSKLQNMPTHSKYLWAFYTCMIDSRSDQEPLSLLQDSFVPLEWRNFPLSGSFFSQLDNWKDQGILSIVAQQFILYLLMNSKWVVLDDIKISYIVVWLLDMSKVLLAIFYNLEKLEPNMVQRLGNVEKILNVIESANLNKLLSPNAYRVIISSLPTKWFGEVSTINNHKSCSSLSSSIAYIYNLANPFIFFLEGRFQKFTRIVVAKRTSGRAIMDGPKRDPYSTSKQMRR